MASVRTFTFDGNFKTLIIQVPRLQALDAAAYLGFQKGGQSFHIHCPNVRHIGILLLVSISATCWCEIYQNQLMISILLLLLSLHLAYLASLTLRLTVSYIIDC